MQTRQQFLEFLGKTALGAAIVRQGLYAETKSELIPLKPTDDDEVRLAPGFRYGILAKQGDSIGKDLKFGDCNDFIAFLSENDSSTEGYLWVNHEHVLPYFIHGRSRSENRDQARLEMEEVGGSFFRVRKTEKGWKILSDDKRNRRITSRTPIPILAERPIKNTLQAIGTLGNCSGGVTPWGTILSCEENYPDFFGEADFSGKKNRIPLSKPSIDWYRFFDFPPEHYGWVVEFDPRSGNTKKHTSLGRFKHEAATVALSPDGIPVVYMGDDTDGGSFYKFVCDNWGSLENGKLYVANLEKGKWENLSIDRPELKGIFQDKTEMLIFTDKAAKLVGGTALPRPEDSLLINETSIIVSLTNSRKHKDPYGLLLRIDELDGLTGTTFKSSKFMLGGDTFACPDNLTLDKKGNLWLCCDMPTDGMHGPKYAKFRNNGLFYIPLSGKDAGKVFQIASAPKDAEFTGPCFTPDCKTLFLSVQHPGELSRPGKPLTSQWPKGRGIGASPKSSVITIEGSMLEKLML